MMSLTSKCMHDKIPPMNNTQITIRNVDPILKQKIVRSARLKSMSINEWVLDQIRHSTGSIKPTNLTPPSWEKCIGAVEDSGINQDVLDDFEKIDTKMWDKVE